MSRVYLILSLVTALVALLGGVQWVVGEYRAWIWRRKQTGKWLLVAALCALPSVADAACSPLTGATSTCTAGSTAGQIQAAIDGVDDEAVITLNNGTYSASGISLVGRNGLTIQCQSVGGCTLTSGSTVFSLDSCSATITNLIRITGFNFTGVGTNLIWIYCTEDIQKLRLDHLDFSSPGDSNKAIFIGEGGGGPPFADRGEVYGVVDHVNCHSASHVFVCVHQTSGGDTWTTGNMGSANALFFEDNICNMTGRGDLTIACVDNWRAHAFVARFNTVTGTNLRAHSYCHYGPESMEVYGNSIDTDGESAPGAWDVHLQGSGEQMVWGNLVTPDDPGGSLHPLGTQSYRSTSASGDQGDCSPMASLIADGTQTGVGTPSDPNDGNRSPTTTYRGYPYWHQPGRDGAATLKPMYDFLNRTRGTGAIDHMYMDEGVWTGLQADCANNDDDRINCHFQKDRDIYWETASFDGTSGTGVGTLASRPATCTPTPESADAGNGGVGYWATDQGSWNQSTSNPQGVQQNGSDGVLYRCSATDTWTVAYTPYTYPHPLQGFAGESPATHLYGLFRASARWMEVASLITVGWHFRRQFLAGTLACAALGGAAWHGLMLTSQRTVSVGKAVLAKSIQAVIEKRGSNG